MKNKDHHHQNKQIKTHIEKKDNHQHIKLLAKEIAINTHISRINK